MADEYGSLQPYGTYGDKNDPSPYDLLMQMKAWNKEIYFTIENMDKEVRTALQVLDGEIRAEILDVQGGLQTQITANAEGVASKVSKTDYNGNTVASLIAQSATAITAMAQALNLSGYVTFSSLTASGTTVIDGSRIQTGYISADRIQASTVLAKLIAAGGIDAGYITSGTISADRLSANAISATLIQAGGISADIINGGTISGVTINSYTDARIGNNLFLNSPQAPYNNKGIYFGETSYNSIGRIFTSNGELSIYGAGLHLSHLGAWSGFVGSDQQNMGLGYSSTSNRLYVRLNGADVGYVTLT